MNSSLFFILLNFFLITIEVTTVAYIPSGFFTRRRSLIAFIVSFVLFVIAANLNAFFLETKILLRIGCVLIVDTIWIIFNFRASFIQSTFLAILVGSFQVVTDNVFGMLSLRTFPNGLALMNDPYAYYFLLYCSKLLQLLIVVLIRSWAKERFHPQKASWADWLRILFFPLATLLIALFLFRMLSRFPDLVGELLGCTVILLITDIVSIFLLNYLESQQNMALENTVLRQNLKLDSFHAGILYQSTQANP